MAKKISQCGSFHTPEILEGHLAARKVDVTALLRNTSVVEELPVPEYQTLETETQLEQFYPQTPILDALEKYLKTPPVKLHIPGHCQGEAILPKFKRIIGNRAVKADTTDDFDCLGQLHPAKGPIKEAQALAAKTFGASHTYFLVNGSTVGNLTLALTVTKPNQKVIVARNCHRSVISGISMSGAVPVWVMPERIDEWGVWGGINPETLETLIKDNPDATAVWLTNPTYEGVISDTKAIGEICRKYDKLFIVDEAHGTHWRFNDNLPTTALELGADAVVNSVHKTGGSFSQSSMLHLGPNSKIDPEIIESNLKMLHSTSPSYTLLASLDSARAFLDSKHGRKQLGGVVSSAQFLRDLINQTPNMHCLPKTDEVMVDPTKLYICVDGLSGRELRTILEQEFFIEVEARTDKGILALANIGNSSTELRYLYDALCCITGKKHLYITENIKHMPFSIPEMVCTPKDAFFASKKKVSPTEAIGQIAAEVIAICPPGIPILVPGERILLEHLDYIRNQETVSIIEY